MRRKNVIVFISGGGSNMEALAQAAARPGYPARIAAVISDQAQAAGIKKAESMNIPVHVLERKSFSSKQQHEEAILECLASLQSDILCLAGYMRLISPRMITPYQGRILNIHPSLLPLFPGLDTHRRAIDSGMKIAGCTVHIVTEKMDEGPILAQAAVPIYKSDDASILAQRVLKAEHCLYPEALRSFINKSTLPAKESQAVYSY